MSHEAVILILLVAALFASLVVHAEKRAARSPEAKRKEFLDELVKQAKAYGWGGDYGEVIHFVEDVHERAGYSLPYGWHRLEGDE